VDSLDVESEVEVGPEVDVCASECELANAESECIDDVCTLLGCLAGYSNIDGVVENGCEYPCVADDSASDLCDGIDNDCDGVFDEDFVPESCGVGVCQSESACVGGEEQSCQTQPAGEPGDEVSCDGRDNDCDGVIDEGISVACSNACGDGESVCQNGQFPACSALGEGGGVCVDINFFCESIPLQFELPLPSEDVLVDVVFLFDRSGSFSDDLANFRARANELTTTLSARVPTVAFGFASFVDAPCEPFGSESDFGFQVDQEITSDLERLSETLGLITVGHGGDAEESQLEAMYQALTGEGVNVRRPRRCRHADIEASDLGWRDRALGFLFVSTDAAYHRPSDTGYPYPHEDADVVAEALARGVRIFQLQGGTSIDSRAEELTELTGGAVLELSSDSAEIVERVSDGLFDALAGVEIGVVAEGDTLGFVTDVFPVSLTGVELLSNRSVTLDVTVLNTLEATGVEQEYTFDLVFFIDDTEIIRRPVTVTIPAEDPKDCNNRPPVIRTFEVPMSIDAGTDQLIGVRADEMDGEELSYEWSVSDGEIEGAEAQSARLLAPTSPGLVDLSVRVLDPEMNYDTESRVVQVLGGACGAPSQRLHLGLAEGRMLLVGEVNEVAGEGSCGDGAGMEEVVILHVHRAGRYLFQLESEEDWQLHIRERDCVTEVACAAGPGLEAELAEGDYYFFVDSPLESAVQHFNLFVEPIP